MFWPGTQDITWGPRSHPGATTGQQQWQFGEWTIIGKQIGSMH